MLEFKWYMIGFALMMMAICAGDAFKEKQRTERYTACIKELKDVEKCKKGN